MVRIEFVPYIRAVRTLVLRFLRFIFNSHVIAQWWWRTQTQQPNAGGPLASCLQVYVRPLQDVVKR